MSTAPSCETRGSTRLETQADIESLMPWSSKCLDRFSWKVG